MSNQPRLVDWGRGDTIRKVIGSSLHHSVGDTAKSTPTLARFAPSKRSAPLPQLQAQTQHSLAKAKSAMATFELAKRGSDPGEIARARRELEAVQSELEKANAYEKSLGEIREAMSSPFRLG